MSVGTWCRGCPNETDIDHASNTCPESGTPECKAYQKKAQESFLETCNAKRKENEKLAEELGELSAYMLQMATFFRETDPQLSYAYYKRSETCRLAANKLAARKEGR